MYGLLVAAQGTGEARSRWPVGGRRVGHRGSCGDEASVHDSSTSPARQRAASVGTSVFETPAGASPPKRVDAGATASKGRLGINALLRTLLDEFRDDGSMLFGYAGFPPTNSPSAADSTPCSRRGGRQALPGDGQRRQGG